MAFLNEYTGELHLKILLAGGRGAGKSTNLQSLYKRTAVDVATRLVDISGVETAEGFFEFLPLSLGRTQAHPVRLHLYTLPAHDFFPALNQTLFLGVDGLVFIVDSRLSALEENERQLARVEGWLVQCARRLDDVPLLFQYNHRDAPDALPLRALRSQFTRPGLPEMEAVALQDLGVLETIDAIADAVLATLEPHTPGTDARAGQGPKSGAARAPLVP